MLDIPTASALLTRTRPRRSRDGYPAHVRAQLAALASAELAAGSSLSATSRRLGLAGSTLSRWLAAEPEPRPAFVPVVFSESPAPSPAPSPTSPLAVVTPAGFRVEGLDLDGVVAVLRRLS